MPTKPTHPGRRCPPWVYDDDIDDPDQAADPVRLAEQAILRTLLHDPHAWTRGELEHHTTGTDGIPLDAVDAVDHLAADGIIHLTGRLATLSRAARRTAELLG